jgi:hypothetical protein
MGLGKTLTMISAIADTAEHALKCMHANSRGQSQSAAMTDEFIFQSRATLVIVTSART